MFTYSESNLLVAIVFLIIKSSQQFQRKFYNAIFYMLILIMLFSKTPFVGTIQTLSPGKGFFDSQSFYKSKCDGLDFSNLV